MKKYISLLLIIFPTISTVIITGCTTGTPVPMDKVAVRAVGFHTFEFRYSGGENSSFLGDDNAECPITRYEISQYVEEIACNYLSKQGYVAEPILDWEKTNYELRENGFTALLEFETDYYNDNTDSLGLGITAGMDGLFSFIFWPSADTEDMEYYVNFIAQITDTQHHSIYFPNHIYKSGYAKKPVKVEKDISWHKLTTSGAGRHIENIKALLKTEVEKATQNLIDQNKLANEQNQGMDPTR